MATTAEIEEMLVYWRNVEVEAMRPKHRKYATERVRELELQLKGYSLCGICGTMWLANESLPCPKCTEGSTQAHDRG